MRLITRPVAAGPCFTNQLGRREFVTAAGAFAGAALLPAVATADRLPAPLADATVILFQGSSIPHAGRDRTRAQANVPRGLGTVHPLFAAAVALAGHPPRAVQLYPRPDSG